ncbi:MAG: hypothetical protein ABIH11_02925 [Candidatus Altiarchaeota archaeon]
MRVAGLDLAGSPKNESGLCVLEVESDVKSVSTSILYSDEDIVGRLLDVKPKLVAVDAPMVYNGENRGCDALLHDYGALPVTLKGMEMLAIRGVGIARQLRENSMEYVEVYSKATARILGLYSKDDFRMQKNMVSLNLEGDINSRLLSRDELDAILAAITGYLYIEGQTRSVGGEDGVVQIPEV